MWERAAFTSSLLALSGTRSEGICVIVGVVKENKVDENRVGLLPVGVEALAENGHRVLIESDAGLASGVLDEDYRAAGAEIVKRSERVYDEAAFVVRVKEPREADIKRLRPGQILFCYFHFAANRELTLAIKESGIVALAYETVQLPNGELPLLVPMSEVAGRMALQEGAKYLERPQGGRGILLAGVPGVAPADVVILGGGVVGSNAARIAAGLGANVFVLDINLERLRYLEDIMPPNVTTLMSNRYNLNKLISSADLVVGAVLRPGARAPRIVTRKMISGMKEGAVIVDVSVDQGGCVETCRPTTHSQPTYKVDEVIHYCVTNIPGAVPRTSTFALTNATLPYIVEIANRGWKAACRGAVELARGLNMIEGRVTHAGVAEAWGLSLAPVAEILGDSHP